MNLGHNLKPEVSQYKPNFIFRFPYSNSDFQIFLNFIFRFLNSNSDFRIILNFIFRFPYPNSEVRRLFYLSLFHSHATMSTSDASFVQFPINGRRVSVSSVSFSPDGLYLCSGSSDKTVHLWNVETGKVVRTFIGHTDWVRSVSFSPDGSYICSGSDDNTVRLWNTKTGDLVRTLNGHTEPVNSVSFSPKDNLVCSGSDDETVRLWNVEDGDLVRTFIGHTDCVNSVSFSPDGLYVCSGSHDNTVRLRNTETGKVVRTLNGHTYSVNSVAFSPKDNLVCSGSGDKTVRLWNTETGETVRTLNGHTDAVTSVSFSPDGLYVCSGSADITVRLWNTETGETIHTLYGHTDIVNSVAFSPDGRYICSGSNDCALVLWNVKSGKEIKRLEEHTRNVNSVAFSPDGLYVCSVSDDKTTVFWNIEIDKFLRLYNGKDLFNCISFSPVGELFCMGGTDGLHAYSFEKTLSKYTSTAMEVDEPEAPSLPKTLFPGYILETQLVGSDGHSSPSEIWTGYKIEDPGKRLTFKIFFDHDGVPLKFKSTSRDRLLYESEMYRAISDVNALKRNTVQFVDFVKGSTHGNKKKDKRFTAAESKQIDDLIGRLKIEDPVKFSERLVPRAIVTNYEEGSETLSEWSNQKQSEEDWKSVFFQIIWVIQTLARCGFQHNDLKTDNILISSTWPNYNRSYEAIADDVLTQFLIPRKSPRVIFFDWDFGSRKWSINSSVHQNNWTCTDYGRCETINEKPDLYALFYSLKVAKDVPPKALAFQRSIVVLPQKNEPDRYNFYKNDSSNDKQRWYPCNLENGKCKPYPPDKPWRIKSTQLLLKDDYFMEFKKRTDPISIVSDYYLRKPKRPLEK